MNPEDRRKLIKGTILISLIASVIDLMILAFFPSRWIYAFVISVMGAIVIFETWWEYSEEDPLVDSWAGWPLAPPEVDVGFV